MRRNTMSFAAGVLTGAVLFGGSVAYAAGVLAEPSWQNIYVDGKKVEMTAYNINGNNYVKLRDIGQAVGFNVYWDGGVQIDSTAPYTGEAPAVSTVPINDGIQISSYKGNTIPAGERSGLIVGPSGPAYTVTSSNPAVVSVESVMGFWTAVAKAPGTAKITATAPDGKTGSVTITVTSAAAQPSPEPGAQADIDLAANMEVRQEMIRLINEVRRKNGAGELTVNDALMNAAQDCSAQGFTTHHNQYECESGLAYGYPHGFGSNLPVFTGASNSEIAQRAVNNWVNSSGHFQTMITQRYECIGVGVTIDSTRTCCYMFVGDSNSYNPYG